MQVLHPNPTLGKVDCQIFCHLLGEGSDENAFVLLNSHANLFKKVINLPLRRFDNNLRVDEAGWPDDLLYRVRILC